jgi:hypothetical protein
MIVLDVQGRGRFEAEFGVRVGRHPTWSNLRLSHDAISRHHLEIRTDGRSYTVVDLGSSNGTAVNGSPLGASGRVLQLGDVIRLGDALDMTVLELAPAGEPLEPTVARSGTLHLRVELHGDRFLVEYRDEKRRVRDSMSHQLGLALSLLALYQRDGFGPVPDADFRAIVWRGDRKQREDGDINRLLLRLRKWFKDRDLEPPLIERPWSAAVTQLHLPAPSLAVEPDEWLRRFLDE